MSQNNPVDNFLTLGRLLMGAPAGPDVDWAGLMALVRRHRVGPFLCWRLEELDSNGGNPDVPEQVREALRIAFHRAVARRAAVERQLGAVLGALAGADVRTMVVKGASLAGFYPHPALRIYNDLDILVPFAQLDRAETEMHRLGYRSGDRTGWDLERVHHLPHMVSDAVPLLVEVHWRLDKSGLAGRLPVEDLWQRVEPWSVIGHPALRLEDVDTALYVCWHGIVLHRLQEGLRPLCDFALVTEAWELSRWKTLVRRAEEYDLTRSVTLMLELVDRVLGRAAPVEVLDALRPDSDQSLPDDLVGQLLCATGSQATHVPLSVIRISSEGTLLSKLQTAFRHLYPPRDVLAIGYKVPANSPRIWLLYLWRPVDVLWRYGRSLWGGLRGESSARRAWNREAWLEQWLNAEG